MRELGVLLERPRPGASLAVLGQLPAAVATPVLACQPAVLRARYAELVRQLPRADVHYAVKCNPDPLVLRTLAEEGSSFEIASLAELDLVEGVGADPSEVLYSNPVKPPGHIEATAARGVRHFAFDSEGELRKLARLAPGARVYVRLAVDDTRSLFPLSRKFGCSADEASRLMQLAPSLGLVPYGVTFHVGSQCTDLTAWERAIGRCGFLLRSLHRAGIEVDMLDIGGGFPATYDDPVPAFAEIAGSITAALARLPHRPPRLVVEPGRYLVAESCTMVARVIGTAKRDGARWAYLDVGGYNGLTEALQTAGRWRFPITCDRIDPEGPVAAWTLTGPSCDSTDTMFYGVELPASLDVDDIVLIGSAGAYSISYASSFNGFPPPSVVAVAVEPSA